MNTSTARRPVYPYRFEAAVRSAAWGWLGGRIVAFIVRRRAAQTVRALSRLNNKELCDIGVLRSEIEATAVKSAAGR